MKQNAHISVGSSVVHKSEYGMQKATGMVVAEAGTRYGRRYLWVNYTIQKSKKTFNTAFWDQVLVPTSKKSIVQPGTIPSKNALL